MHKKVFFIACYLFCIQGWSLDVYDLNTNQLSIPLVNVGGVTYKNVVVNVGNVLSIGNSPVTGSVDTYVASTNQLIIPAVKVASSIYYNVSISLGPLISVGSSSINFLSQPIDSTIFSLAGIWQPVGDSFINPTSNGAHTNSFGNIKLFGSKGESVILSGWNTSGFGTVALNSVIPINVGILEYQNDGTLKLQTSKYISDSKTNGNWFPLIADFNGDGQPDIFLAAHNESPLINSSSTAYLSNSNKTFDKVQINDAVMAHQPSLYYVNNKPTVFASLLGYGPIIYQYQGNGSFSVNTRHNSYSYGISGDSHVVGDFLNNGQLEYVSGDMSWAPDFTTHPSNTFQLMEMYAFDSTLTLQPQHIATFTPYFFDSKYASFFNNTTNIVLEPRLWSDDFNHDGMLDVLGISGIWSQDGSINWSKSILQMFQNRGNLQFSDVTNQLNSQWDINSDPDYEMQIVDIDHSGIKSFLIGSGSFLTHPNGNGNYILLNDGTGSLYSAFHTGFESWSQQVNTFTKSKYSGYVGMNYIPNFRGYLDDSGLLNYVAGVNGGYFNSSNLWTVQDVFVNLPTRINITTDFTQNITISDRNNSMLMRTWAGDDTIYDKNANASLTKIDGGLGLNTAVYSGSKSQYSITKSSDGTVSVVSNSSALVQVNDVLKNIQIVKFADQSIILN